MIGCFAADGDKVERNDVDPPRLDRCKVVRETEMRSMLLPRKGKPEPFSE